MGTWAVSSLGRQAGARCARQPLSDEPGRAQGSPEEGGAHSWPPSSGKASFLSKRSTKKLEGGKSEGTSYDVPGSPEDVEKNQKIMQWIIEGEKEISRHKKTTHG